MRAIRPLAGLIVLVIVVLGSEACSPEPITLEEVVGDWRDMVGGEYLKFNQDQSYIAATSPEFDADGIVELGNFTLAGRDMTILLSEDSPSCAGETRRYEVETPEERLRLISEDGPCDLRPDAETYELEPVR